VEQLVLWLQLSVAVHVNVLVRPHALVFVIGVSIQITIGLQPPEAVGAGTMAQEGMVGLQASWTAGGGQPERTIVEGAATVKVAWQVVVVGAQLLV
jgi:hypothetical protein